MRTKTLLCMAALAAGVATSMAQNVYSLNIVGYANVTNHLGYNFDTAPFRVTTAVTNGANEVLPQNTGQYDGDAVLLWTGTGWASSGLDSSSPTGFSDSGGNPIPAPILTSGKGFLYQDTIANGNLTFVGEVRAGTNTVPITTATYQALGSPVPFAGDVITSLQLANTGGQLDGDEVLILVNYGQGFAAYGFDSSSGTGFSDSGGNPITGPQINVGQGFFYHNNGTGSHTWTQIFNP